MARSSRSEAMSIYEARNMLEERLTCPGCSKITVEPRVLSCMHVFCYNCIEDIEVEETEECAFITCPTCATTTEYPEGGAAALQPAYHLIAMLEVYKMVYKVQTGDKTSCGNCKQNCAVGYCQNCAQLLCRGCITLHRRWSQFEKHDILGVEQIAHTALQGRPIPLEIIDEEEMVSPEHEVEIRYSLEPIKEQIETLKNAVAEISVRERDIMDAGKEVMSYVQQSSHNVLQTVKESEQNFYEAVQTLVQGKVSALSEQKSELQAVVADLERCEMYVEEELRVATPQQILSSKSQLIDAMEKVGSKSVVEDCVPKESASFSMAPTDELLEKCQDIAKVESAEIAGVQIIDKTSAIGVVGQEVCFDIRVKTNPLGFLIVPDSITCSFACAADGEERVECELEELAPAKYRVTYIPPDKETRQLKVDIDENMHFDVPFTVSVAHIPTLKGKLKSELMKPWGVCINKMGQIIATDFEAHDLKLFNSRGDLIHTLGERGKGKGHFKSPAGIAVNQQNQMVVVESANHRVQIVTDRGDFINFVGGKGEEPLQFSFPYDVAISRSGLMFVSDCYNHRIQVLNSDLTFAGMFGSEGSAPGQFKNPIGVAIDHADRVYIADSGNERIQVFTLAGDFIREFGKQQLTIPSGITVDANDLIYVTDTGIGQVAVFDNFGNFLGHYISKSEEMSRPTGLTVGNGNVLYVCDWGVNNILTLY